MADFSHLIKVQRSITPTNVPGAPGESQIAHKPARAMQPDMSTAITVICVRQAIPEKYVTYFTS